MIMEKCFAYKFNEQKKCFLCEAIHDYCEGCKEGCKYYKTAEQRVKDLDRLNESTRKPTISKFSLLIDGRKHGEFESIQEMDIYLDKYYDLQKDIIEPIYKYMQMHNKDLADSKHDKVMYAQTVRFLWEG